MISSRSIYTSRTIICITLCISMFLNACSQSGSPQQGIQETQTIATTESIVVTENVSETIELPRGEWVELTQMPLPVSRLSGTLVDREYYAIGGITQVMEQNAFTQVYNLQTDSWHQVAPITGLRTGQTTASMGGKIYVFGGSSGFGRSETLAWVYDPAVDVWGYVAEMPATRQFANAVAVGEYIYLAGGKTTVTDSGPGGNGEVLRYQPETDEWTILAPNLVERRTEGAAVFMDGKIYLIGGSLTSGPIESVEIYDIEADSWSMGTPMNGVRSNHAAIVLGDNMFVFGGFTGFVLQSVEIYDPVSDTWAEGPPLPIATHSLVGFVNNNVIYLVGGSDTVEGGDIFGRVLAYRP